MSQKLKIITFSYDLKYKLYFGLVLVLSDAYSNWDLISQKFDITLREMKTQQCNERMFGMASLVFTMLWRMPEKVWIL